MRRAAYLVECFFAHIFGWVSAIEQAITRASGGTVPCVNVRRLPATLARR